MALQINSFGRTSPSVGRTSPPAQVPTLPKYKAKHEKHDKHEKGRTSPNKFVFTLDEPANKTQQKPNQKHTHNHNHKHIQKHNHKYNHIKPILTMTDLEDYQISPIPSSNSPTSSSPSFTNTLDIIENINKGDKEILVSNLHQVSNPQYVFSTTNTHTVSNKHVYNTHLHIINIIKHLVFRNSSLICGYFNSKQLTIDEYTKSFMHQIKSYQQINNVNFTDEQIIDLFMNELVLPETIKRLQLQSSMDILISHSNFINFINNTQTYFNPSVKQNYKLEFINKGKLKDNIDKTNDLNLYNMDGNEIFLNMIKISELKYNISFEIHFIVLYNDKSLADQSYIIPLNIPYGLYNTEDLHITNNGHDEICIQNSSSSMTYIVNNKNMNIISIMPKLNDTDYTKLALYILQVMTTNNTYLLEFDIFNTIHKKSDFWLTNKNTENDPTGVLNCNKCTKCTINISKNTKYVISKCCHKEYHIECMEMNYYTIDHYMYLVCDCGCAIIDENNCNDNLLLALYKHYY